MIVSFLCFVSCESENDVTANDYLSNAWKNISTGHYQMAEANLIKAKNKDGNIDNINLAKSWIKLGQDSIGLAKVYLSNISVSENFINEYKAGELLLLFLDNQYDSLITQSSDFQPSWTHSQLSNFSSKSIIQLRALVYFEKKEYLLSSLEIKKIDPSYTINLENISEIEGSNIRTEMFQKISDLL